MKIKFVYRKTVMKINSFACAVLTPAKNDPNPEILVTPEKEDKCDEGKVSRPSRLFTVSREQKQALLMMRKCHDFLFHGQVTYAKVEKKGLTTSTVAEIKVFFEENQPDISDVVLHQEEEAIKIGDFTEKRKNYISEEFKIPNEYSFLAICLISYSQENSVTITESINHLLNLHSDEFECEKCSSPSSSHEIEDHNLLALKSVLNRSSQADECEDSDDDPPYNPNPRRISSSESEFSSSQVNNPFKDVLENSFESVEVFNPFEQHASKDYEFVNSTLKLDEQKSQVRIFPNESSPIQPQVKRQLSCTNCGRSFNKSYNLKMHLVHVHKHVPKGLKVFKCTFSECTFMAINRIIFNRHGHSKKVVETQTSVLCSICNQKCANKYSLVRHIKRKHKHV